MTISLVEPTQVDQTARIKGGLLDVAHPAPEGWERGLAIPFYGCGEPILRDNCATSTDVGHRPDVQTFGSFLIRQGSICSTLSRLDPKEFARWRLEATSEWAIARQFATNELSLDTPSLADAVSLGTVDEADFVTAVACLEQAAADSGFGAEWVLHAPVRAAAYLKRLKMLDDGLSPAGAKWVISPGYPVEGPTTIRLWATGPVWVGVNEPEIHNDVDWRRNSDEAFSTRSGIVAFDPCMLTAIDVTVPECP